MLSYLLPTFINFSGNHTNVSTSLNFFKKQQQDQIRIEDLEKQLESLTTLNKEVSLILFGIFYIGMSNYTSE
jgi:hypothetical protein